MPKSTLQLSKLLATLPDETRDAILATHPDPESIEVRRKQYTGTEVEFAEGERASIGYITTKAVDRDGEILLPGGARLDAFAANPVVLWGHNASMPPIGKAAEMEITSAGIRAKTLFADTERAQEVWALVKGGFLNAHSIGFIPLAWADRGTKGWDAATKDLTPAEIDGANRVYTKYELLEYSIVSVPANPTALIEARAKGLEISEDMAKSLGVDVTRVTDEPTTPQISMPEVKRLPSINLPTVASVPSLALPQVTLVRQAPDYDAIAREALARVRGEFGS